MAEKQQNPTSGLEPFIAKKPKVTDGLGRQHEVRSPNAIDFFGLMRIIANISGEGQKRLIEAARGQSLSLEAQVGMMLAYGLSSPETERGILEFLASLVGASYEEFTDPQIWPLSAQLDVAIKFIAEHPDVDAFFTKLTAAMTNSEIRERLSRLFGLRGPGN